MFKGIITGKVSYSNGRAYIQIKEENRPNISLTIKRDMLTAVIPFNKGDKVLFKFENPITNNAKGEINYPFLTSIELDKSIL